MLPRCLTLEKLFSQSSLLKIRHFAAQSLKFHYSQSKIEYKVSQKTLSKTFRSLKMAHNRQQHAKKNFKRFVPQ